MVIFVIFIFPLAVCRIMFPDKWTEHRDSGADGIDCLKTMYIRSSKTLTEVYCKDSFSLPAIVVEYLCEDVNVAHSIEVHFVTLYFSLAVRSCTNGLRFTRS